MGRPRIIRCTDRQVKIFGNTLAIAVAATLCMVALSLATNAAFAAPGDANPSGREVGANCAACHGPNGRSMDAAIRSLAGMDKAAISSAVSAFREGRRPSTVMQQLAKGYTDAQIDAAAAFFAMQKR